MTERGVAEGVSRRLAVSGTIEWISGEFNRLLDERHRLTLPTEIAGLLAAEDEACILAKERFGCLSLWNAVRWRGRLEGALQIVKQKLAVGQMADRTDALQSFGRLLSSRYADVRLTERARLLIPEGFREFLAAEPNSEVMVVGAGICIEIWHPGAWKRHLRRRMPEFSELLQELSR